jgi:hypothetical protein
MFISRRRETTLHSVQLVVWGLADAHIKIGVLRSAVFATRLMMILREFQRYVLFHGMSFRIAYRKVV